jgi:hypothetical protein
MRGAHRRAMVLHLTSALETVAQTMYRKVYLVCVAEAAKRRHCVDTKSLACSLTELRPNKRRAVAGETDETLVECGVPEGREEQAVVDIEALLVIAVRPGDDVGSAQQRRVGDAGQGAPAARA